MPQGTAEPVALAGLLQCPHGALSELSQALLGATKLHPAAIILSVKERKNTSSASTFIAGGVVAVARVLTPTQPPSEMGSAQRTNHGQLQEHGRLVRIKWEPFLGGYSPLPSRSGCKFLLSVSGTRV